MYVVLLGSITRGVWGYAPSGRVFRLYKVVSQTILDHFRPFKVDFDAQIRHSLK